MFMSNHYIGFWAASDGLTYTTWNPSDNGGLTLSNGDLTAAGAAGASWKMVRSVSGKSTGKYYFETNVDAIATEDEFLVGIAQAGTSLTAQIGADANSYSFFYAPASTAISKRNNGSNTALTSTGTLATSDKLMVAFDAGGGNLWFGENGTWFDSGDPGAGTNAQFTGLSGTFYAAICLFSTGETGTTNFGTTAFAHSIPSGFTGWTV